MRMTIENLSDNSDEISLLDLLIPLVENIRLLVLGPVLAGLFAFGVSYLFPPTFESVAVQLGDPQLVAMYNSAQTRAKIVESIEYTEKGETASAAQDRLKNNLIVGFDKRDGTVRIVAKADDPSKAQKLAETAIEVVAVLNKRRVDSLSRLSEQFDLSSSREREYSAAAQRVAQLILDSGAGANASLVQAQAQLLSSARDAQMTTAEMAGRLAQAQRFDLVQEPTLPYKKSTPKRAYIASIVGIATGLVLLLLVFISSAARRVSQDASAIEKMTALRSAWKRAVGRG